MDIVLWLTIAAIFFLLTLSAFFSGAETAVTASSHARMHSLEKDGSKRAAMVVRLKEKRDRLLGVLLLGNNAVNILSSALATSVLIKLFGEMGVAYATVVMTLLVLIFSEVLPKTYALHHADRAALVLAPALNFFYWLLAPVAGVVVRIVRAILKVFSADMSQMSGGLHIDELRGTIELYRGEAGGVGKKERDMLRSILDLSDVTVAEVMVHRKNVEMINADLSPAGIVDEVLRSEYTRLPLWKDKTDNIIGILNVKLLLRELRNCGGDISRLDVRAAMLEPWFIPESTTLFDQLQQFRDRREHLAIMVDEYGALQGVVTLEDILEEIVGEIGDEHDVSVSGVKLQQDGTYLIEGKVTLRDLNRDLGWDLADDEGYSTLAGLLLFCAQRIPNVGQVFRFDGFKFEIVRRQRNQLALIRVTKLPADTDADREEKHRVTG